MAQRRKSGIPNVALLIETTRSFGRQVLRGIADYGRIYGPWLFHMPTEIPLRGVPPKDEWQGDGIIAQPHQNQSFVRQLAEAGIPVVSLSGPPGVAGLPAVRPNQDAVARLAMEHFRERAFVHFAYCGSPSEVKWPPTGKLFKAMAEADGYPCAIYEGGYAQAARTLRLADMAKWLRSMPRPVALLAGNDLRAREILDACHLAKLHAPEEVAVLGVNDDELICEMANPPLSSVMHNGRRIGYEAAAMLHRLMMGKKVLADVVVDPLGVKSRQSTDLLAIDDADVAAAVRFIRENACKGIRVDDVLDQVPLSRRSLEKRFRQSLGRLPHAEIRRVQIERVKDLLVTTDYKLERIAEITGFSTAQYLAGLFHRVAKMTPGAWRQAGRARTLHTH
ncbi:MAG TPA: DNA-binding transcriptional regulator [Tepidisphaeraceae bacterium]|nr:DNA-binding transcriptional regulator [Tepidisphaeraceae bacterium]